MGTRDQRSTIAAEEEAAATIEKDDWEPESEETVGLRGRKYSQNLGFGCTRIFDPDRLGDPW